LSISYLIGIPQFIAPLPISNKPFDIQIYLVRLQAMFAASTYSIVGDGQTTKFWDDRWLNGQSILEIAPQLHACIPKRRRKARTVADGLNAHTWARDIHGNLGIDELGQYLLLWRQLEHITLFNQPDQLVWRWTPPAYTRRNPATWPCSETNPPAMLGSSFGRTGHLPG
jgi:hypothetical protein